MIAFWAQQLYIKDGDMKLNQAVGECAYVKNLCAVLHD